MITRQQASEEVLELSKQCDILYIECATGFGKSKMAMDIQNNLNNLKYLKVLILIAEKAHELNWKQEYAKHNQNNLLINTYFSCYASLHKLKDTQWDLIICDESHHISPLRLQHLSTIKFNKMLLLSATMKKSVKAMLEWTFKDKKFNGYKITTDEAIEANILPEPKIFIHQLLLNNSFRYSEIVIKRKTGSSIACCSYPDRWQYIKDVQFKVINILCTEQEKYNYLSDQVNFWKQKTMNNPTNPFNRNKWMRAALDRKVYLGELKTDYIQHLLYEIPKSERLICFCTSINQANELHNDYNDESIVHSKIKNVEKIIQDFQNKETNALFCVNMLKEGMNLNDIDTGIIIQLDSVELSFIQKLGRVLRADSPNIHIIYYKNTRDADYLSKILKLIDRKYIKVIRPK